MPAPLKKTGSEEKYSHVVGPKMTSQPSVHGHIGSITSVFIFLFILQKGGIYQLILFHRIGEIHLQVFFFFFSILSIEVFLL